MDAANSEPENSPFLKSIADFSRDADTVFGVVRACRRSALPDAERMVGLFINTLPMRAVVAPNRRLIDWLIELRASYVASRPFEHTPLLAVRYKL